MSGQLLWEPSEERQERATMQRFMRERGFDDYQSLWQWSVDELEEFWAAVWEFFGVDATYGRVLAERTMPDARWFTGARVNYAEHILRGKDDAAVAMLARSEVRPELRELTWGEVRDLAGRIAAGLTRLGVHEGDRVVAYMPNIPETMAAFLAVASLGAIWSSAAPEYASSKTSSSAARPPSRITISSMSCFRERR